MTPFSRALWCSWQDYSCSFSPVKTAWSICSDHSPRHLRDPQNASLCLLSLWISRSAPKPCFSGHPLPFQLLPPPLNLIQVPQPYFSILLFQPSAKCPKLSLSLFSKVSFPLPVFIAGYFSQEPCFPCSPLKSWLSSPLNSDQQHLFHLWKVSLQHPVLEVFPAILLSSSTPVRLPTSSMTITHTAPQLFFVCCSGL
jgi:hypothetical protein